MDKVDSSNTNSKLIIDIHNFLQEGEKNITYKPGKDIVLLLGNTGSGKSTLTQYISGNDGELESIEIGKDSGNFLIIDKKNKISSKSTIVSQTIYPDLVEDAKTNTLYYDCPGFSDTRSAAHEIAATYFIKKVIDSARAVKMVFVVNHNSVSAAGNRNDLVQMLQHSANFIKKLETFKNSIALVVTKIENIIVRSKIVPDEKVINAVGDFLKQAKEDLKKNTEMVNPNTKDKVMSLLDIFLSKGENEQYTRIGIFRKPDESGPLNKIALLQEGKITLENLINNNIKFAEVSKDDFGYTISAKSIVHIGGLTEEINKTIINLLSNIGKEVEKHCISQEENISDLEDFITTFQKLREPFIKLQENAIKDTINPEMFITEIKNNIKNIKTTISDDKLKTVRREEDYINFLNLLSNQSIKNHKSSLLAAGLSNLTKYLNESHLFYRFLYDMFQTLSEYKTQKKRNRYNSVHLNVFNDLFESPVYNEIDSVFKQHGSIKEMELDKAKLTLLNRVLDETLKHKIEFDSPETNKIVVTGVNVMLSDLSEALSNSGIKFIEVYALHKVFIDTSVDLTGREVQIAIIAPVWEVLGSQSIILDGKRGMDHHHQKASSGHRNGDIGTDGQPGEPGGPAGNFIGIGKRFVNAKYLRISANGGQGGRGQDGGDGAGGYDGAHCESCKPSSSSLITVFYNKADTEFSGQNGGNGGNGGIGGYGGHKGYINIIKVGNEAGVVGVEQSALDGLTGEHGKGGNGGGGGRYFNYKMRNYVLLISHDSFEPINKWADNGEPGKDGANLQERHNTWELTKLMNINNLETKSRSYLQTKINSSLQSKLIISFIDEMSTQLPLRRKRREIARPEELSRNNEDEYDPKEMQTRYYNQYVTDSYRLGLHSLLDSSTTTDKPVFNNFFLGTDGINHSRTKPNFFKPAQLENVKIDKNIYEQHSSINFHGNLLLSEMILKKIMRKETSLHIDNNHNSKVDISPAHDLAYRYYRKGKGTTV